MNLSPRKQVYSNEIRAHIIMKDNLSPAQLKILKIALEEGKVIIGGEYETPGIHYRVINNLLSKGYLDYQVPDTINIESEWVPTAKAMLYEKDYLQSEIADEKTEKKLKYQVKVPMKGYKLCNVVARNAQEAKRKVNELSSEIERIDNYIYRSGKATTAKLIKQASGK